MCITVPGCCSWQFSLTSFNLLLNTKYSFLCSVLIALFRCPLFLPNYVSVETDTRNAAPIRFCAILYLACNVLLQMQDTNLFCEYKRLLESFLLNTKGAKTTAKAINDC